MIYGLLLVLVLALINHKFYLPTCFAPSTFNWAKEQASFDTPQLSLVKGAVQGGQVYSWNALREKYTDFNNDGFIDRVWMPEGKVDWWIAFGSNSGFQTPQLLIKETSKNPKLRSYLGRHEQFIDVNKDYFPDLVLYPYQGGTGLYVMYSNGKTLEEPKLWLQNGTAGVNVYSHEGRYETYLDINKDGYPDKVWVPSGKHDLWVAFGTGTSFNQPQILLAAGIANGKNPYSYNGWRESYADVNGDGLADKIWIPHGLLDIWVALGNGKDGFEAPSVWLKRSDSPVNIWSTSGIRKWYADMNGDGRADHVWIPSGISDLYVSYSTGNSFTTPKSWLTANIPNIGHPHSYAGRHESIVDVNSDGFPDRVWVPEGPGANGDLYVALSDHGNGFLTPQKWMENTINKIYNRSHEGRRETYVDVNGDGLVDKVWIPYQKHDLYVAKGIVTQANVLLSVTNGQNTSTNFSYKVLTDSSVYTKGTGATYPSMDFISPISVVSKLSTDDGLGGQRSVSYHYAGGKVDLNGRGFRGFSKVTQTDDSTGIQQITFYERDYRYLSTKEKRKETRLPDGTLIAETDNTASLKDYGNGVHFSRIEKTVSKSYELDGSLISTNTTSNQFDDCGNPTQVRIDSHDGRVETTINRYDNSSSCVSVTADGTWILGRLRQAEVSRSVVGQSSQTRTSAWEYDAQSGLLVKEIIEPGNALCVEKIYSHDAYGNILQSTTQACASTKPSFEARSQFSEYDSNGRYLLKNRNALGHEEVKQYDKFGNKIKLTGPNGLETRWNYDGFGRPILETRADGTWTQTAYRLNTATSTCPKQAHYFTQSQSVGGNVNYQCFDKLDRELRKASFGFNGQLIFVDTEYNTRGEVVRKSEPYFSTDSPNWTQIEYDILSRPIKQTAPDQSLSRVEYQGLKTTSINALGQRKVEEKDAHGNLIKSTDNHAKSVTYIYDGFNNLLQMSDSLQNTTQIFYDQRGNKIKLRDPDTGETNYIHNPLGELISQIDAKGQTVSFRYDKLGRMVERTEPEGTSTWQYDTATKGIGKLATMIGADGYQQQNSYDSFGRLAQTSTLMKGQTYSLNTQYDQYGRVAALTYPTGFAVLHEYNDYGYLSIVRNANNNTQFWEAKTMNARGQLEEQQFGNGLSTQKTYDPLTGFVQTIKTDSLQDLSYKFDALGNLLERNKGFNLTEKFSYDGLNRLTRTQIIGGKVVNISYDEIGNILSKTGVGMYAYGANNAGPHAVTSAGGITYTYDAVGNRISNSNGQQIQYSSYNKPTLISQGTTELSFKYNPERARYQQTIVSNGETTELLYLGKLYEQETSSGVTQYKHHIFAGDKAVAVHIDDSNNTSKTSYLHRDHLGSVESITDEKGTLDTALSFDAWGQRRSEQWDTLSQQEIRDLVNNTDLRRGFTGHEHLDEVNLIHMNGRVYDPIVGRFLSADPVIQSPGNMQNLNRYSYVLNNPLSYSDPSGFFFKKIFRAVKKFVKKIWKPVVATIAGLAIGVVTFGIGSALGGAIAGMGFAGAGFLGGLTTSVLSGAGFGFGSAFASSLANGGSISNALKAGLKGGLIGGAIAGVNIAIGALDKIANPFMNFASKTIAHGVVQGLQNMAKGGRFQHGFLTSIMGKVSGKLRSLVTAGTASAIGGGKFLNGAASGSFSYLFNKIGNSLKNIAKKLINLPAQIISHGAYYAGMNDASKGIDPSKRVYRRYKTYLQNEAAIRHDIAIRNSGYHWWNLGKMQKIHGNLSKESPYLGMKAVFGIMAGIGGVLNAVSGSRPVCSTCNP
jgi:RHS repeat-associated protein